MAVLSVSSSRQCKLEVMIPRRTLCQADPSDVRGHLTLQVSLIVRLTAPPSTLITMSWESAREWYTIPSPEVWIRNEISSPVENL